MSDRETAQSEDEEVRDRGLPLFWGFLLVATVTVIAVLLFRQVDFGTGDGVSASTGATESTLADEPTTTTTTALELGSIIEVLESDPRFATLLSVIDLADLSQELSGVGPYLLFAPTNASLGAVDLPDDKAVLRSFVLRHIYNRRLTVPTPASLTMMNGDTYATALGVDTPAFALGGIATSIDPLEAVNGFVYPLDGVLPPSVAWLLEADGRFTVLLSAVESSGLADSIASDAQSIFAPTDAAFAALPDGVLDQLLDNPDRLAQLLRHHVVPGSISGEGVYETSDGNEVTFFDGTVNGVPIAADLPGANVVPIDAVLIPPGFVLADVNQILDLAPITFEAGSAVITADGQAELDRAVEYLIANPVPVEIGGHTDSDGSDEGNQALSEQRAQAVVDYLVTGGVDGDLLTAIGYGESQPIATNDTDEGKAQNRRIEFSILGG